MDDLDGQDDMSGLCDLGGLRDLAGFCDLENFNIFNRYYIDQHLTKICFQQKSENWFVKEWMMESMLDQDRVDIVILCN